MHARVSTYQFPDTTNIDEAVSVFQQGIRELPGPQEAVLLVDRNTGKAMTITFWESEQAVIESREAADRVRSEATGRARGEITSVEEFEVALKE